MNAQLHNFHITLMEIDTIGPIANCLCFFDLSVKIGPLSTGTYTVDIFGTDIIYGDTIYFGSTSFTIGNSINPGSLLVISQYQSDCYNLTNIDHFDEIILGEFEFAPIYPNPFNTQTIINFFLPTSENVELSIYNLEGQKITTLINRYMSSGEYSKIWDGSNLPSGIYFVRIKYGNVIKIQKAFLIK